MSQQHQTPAGEDLAALQALLDRAERDAVPAVFRGVALDWPPARKWQSYSYLRAAAGDARVECMHSLESDEVGTLSRRSNFAGAIDRHESVSCSFDDFLDLCADALKEYLACDLDRNAATYVSSPSTDKDNPRQEPPRLYLAQQPLTAEAGLGALAADASPPPPLLNAARRARIEQVNFWMSSSSTRSSLHYDAHQNLLVLLNGAKTVVLLPPGAALGVDARPAAGDAANHAGADLAAVLDSLPYPGEPWESEQQELQHSAAGQVLRVQLVGGDALFLPEGWWHQVDSTPGAQAVNFWWPSQATAALRAAPPHMAAYYARAAFAAATAAAADDLAAASVHAPAQTRRARSRPPCAAARRGVHAPAPMPTTRSGNEPKKRRKVSDVDWAVRHLLRHARRDGGSLAQQQQGEEEEEDEERDDEGDRRQEAGLPLYRVNDSAQLPPPPPHSPESGEPSHVLADDAWHVLRQTLHARLLMLFYDANVAGVSERGTAAAATAATVLGAADAATRTLKALGDARRIVRALYVLSRADAAAPPALLRSLPPLGAQLVTRALEDVDAELGGGGGDGGLPAREELYAALYGGGGGGGGGGEPGGGGGAAADASAAEGDAAPSAAAMAALLDGRRKVARVAAAALLRGMAGSDNGDGGGGGGSSARGEGRGGGGET